MEAAIFGVGPQSSALTVLKLPQMHKVYNNIFPHKGSGAKKRQRPSQTPLRACAARGTEGLVADYLRARHRDL